ncbi:NADH dehydrogenase I chain G [Buchnera aphidicola str. Bp (Baizongia pistaciae)]|uniref:NADH-quinone oxidoreductase subunit G n=1 Tax=Buchnera aphidicola subsp. Baizongia pistaciae (strain Bp) TaxID=224915 RepID=NUOG_BUCBP|nr:NADH-quinone oxidoreductase subunit NuoG [Buchnera aphidicola]Q89AU1.1 RecName: Full=NADH-quinone oxidoreductase subunit G; AltName: Full=NADH dehydrogenase I subunit G; AltName: Full=NDH-1 subunit G [Buchnera aphidicola str. Bp (Baizongia pistaciae)]AAO26882.1 NADH dehydrogenase I chain G [Buchnera aphidicola str. Bp (Baizongia pistaciae)]
MTIIFVDNEEYNVDKSDNLLQACLSSGINIPYFCWHPVLGSIGSCRQCAVTIYKDLEDKVGQLVMSCMTSVLDGMIVSTSDKISRNFRKGIIELLMLNHPHDCPICEEGGSCHLQDMTVMAGHTVRRYRFTKRTHKNQYLGHFITHEMNRCISCYRCVRYYKDYSGGTDLGVFGISNNVYFGRYNDGCLESEFSGNLVEVCPTGVFTDKTYSKKYSRKWDMQYAPSICQHCCVGCNISVGEKYGKISRIENRYHNAINHYFLCDLGRFSYDYSNVDERLTYSIYRSQNKTKIINDVNKTIDKLAMKFKKSSKIIGIGSCRASVESNFSLQKLVGSENFYLGISQKEYDCLMLIKDILKDNQIHVPTLREIEKSDVIFLLGEDVTKTSPLIALSIRQSIKGQVKTQDVSKNIPIWHADAVKNSFRNNKNKLFITNLMNSSLDDIADESYYASTFDQVLLGAEVYKCISNNCISNVTLLKQDLLSCAKRIATALTLSKCPLIISGSHSYNLDLIKVSFNIAKSLKVIGKNVGLILLSSNVNSIGVSLLEGISIEKVINKVLLKQIDKIIVLENDLYRYLPESIVDTLFKSSSCTVVIDHLNTRTLKQADIAIPTCNSFESSGTVVNYEGRAQRFFKTYHPNSSENKKSILESWKWLHLLYCKLHKISVFWHSLDDVIEEISLKIFSFSKLKDVAPNSSFKIFGQKLARSHHRASGRTALYSNINIHEPRPPQDNDTMFSFSMEGCQNVQNYLPYVPFSWFPGWNSVQSWNTYKKINNENYGKHLFQDTTKFVLTYYKLNCKNVNKIEDLYLIVPCYFLFCNNELAQYSPVIQENVLKNAYGIINTEDAKVLLIESGSKIEFSYLNKNFSIKVQLSKEFKKGQLGLPLGMADFPFFLAEKQVKVFRKISI